MPINVTCTNLRCIIKWLRMAETDNYVEFCEWTSRHAQRISFAKCNLFTYVANFYLTTTRWMVRVIGTGLIFLKFQVHLPTPPFLVSYYSSDMGKPFPILLLLYRDWRRILSRIGGYRNWKSIISRIGGGLMLKWKPGYFIAIVFAAIRNFVANNVQKLIEFCDLWFTFSVRKLKYIY